jgi:serine/threonine protein phosphatase PrpC
LSFGTHNNNSNNNIANSSIIPQDFYDPKDGHLWRAKYCVLEDGVLYFYRNANDGDSMEAAAERKRTHQEEMDGMDRSSPIHANNIPAVPPPTASTLSRRRSSAQDLSKSPMIRPMMIHHLDSVGGGGGGVTDSSGNHLPRHCMWEKRVFLDCIEEVRTAEQQFGKNSFELTAVTDDEIHVDKLVLKAPNQSEMNEWIFQFHRSLASFMRDIMDVFASTSSSGVFLDIHRPSNMLTPAHSSHRTPLQMAASIPHSPSEKQLQRLMAMSPRFHHHLQGLSGTPIQPTLSHGHGRTSLRRRANLKRTSSEGEASVASTTETAEAEDSPQHEFAFREPSPLQRAPESISPPRHFLIPPPTTGAARPSAGVVDLRMGIFALENRHRIHTPTPPSEISEPELSAPPSEVPEMERPKPATGKYIPPHLRNRSDDGSSTSKSKYIPPHLRRQQDPSGKKYVSPSMRNDFNDVISSTPPTASASMSLAERAQMAPSTPVHRESPVGATMSTLDNLDIVESSTTKFVRGGCADPVLIEGSVLDHMYIPRKASRVGKASTEAFGSFGGEQMNEQENSATPPSQRSCLRWEIGAVSECGVRDHNEDAFLITNDLLSAFESGCFGQLSQTFWTKDAASHSAGLFAIFDGHCGNQAARFAVERLAHFIHEELHQSPETEFPFSPAIVEAVLHDSITKMDDAFCNVCQEDGREWESGATALVAMIVNEHLVIANIGDCRGVLCRSVQDTATYKASSEWSILEDLEDEIQGSISKEPATENPQNCYWKEVTNTHTPAAEKEKHRIEKANGWITTDTEIPIAQLRRMDFLDEDVIAIVKRCLHHPGMGNATLATDSERSTKECKAAPQRILHISRICGELAVSRALGDRDFKAQFNSLSSQHVQVPFSESSDSAWWDCPLFLTYPDDHNRRFQGDLVINTPDFQRVKLGEDGVSDEFLLLACDGLWDVMDTDDAVRVVRDLLFRKKWTAKRAAARLAELAIHLGSSDNVTVIVVRLFLKKENERT